MHASPSPLAEPSKAPFVTHGKRGQALYLHGYSSTPYEVRFVADAMEDHGFGGTGILLPGHGTKVEDLAAVKAEDWLDAARTAYASLDDDGPRVIVAASMGGLLALMLAAQEPVDAMVLLSASLRMKPAGEIGQRLGRSVVGEFLPIVEKQVRGGDVGDPEGQEKNPTYPAMDMSAVGELGRLRDQVVPLLHRVTCPTLLFHGAKDQTIELDATTEIAESIRAPYVETVFLPHSQHILGLDVERDEIASRTADFLDVILPAAEGA